MAYSQPSWKEVMGDSPRTESNESAYRQRCFNRCPDSVQFKCTACESHFNKHEGYWLTACDHQYCRDCLEHLFRLSMRDREYYPPSCCQAIDKSSVRHLLSFELMTKFSIFEASAKDQDPTYCHACTKYIMRFRYSTEEATCGSCAAATCRFCKRAFHDGDCVVDAKAEEGEKAAAALASKQGWQSCPSCKETVELNTGCFHMTCLLCKTEFCYLCAAPWKTCRCPQADPRRLLLPQEQADEDDTSEDDSEDDSEDADDGLEEGELRE